MAEQEGYIKIDRNILHWGWFTTVNTAHLFVTLLLKANYKDMVFDGKPIKVGSLVTSLQTLSEISGLTIQQCRTALKHLKSTGEITSKSYSRYQVITIVNYKQYQEATRLLTGKQQATNRQSTGNQQQEKGKKEGNKGNKRKNPPKSPQGGLDPSGVPERGTAAFKAKSHILLKPDEGTLDDIPDIYHGMFKTFEEYVRYRNR